MCMSPFGWPLRLRKPLPEDRKSREGSAQPGERPPDPDGPSPSDHSPDREADSVSTTHPGTPTTLLDDTLETTPVATAPPGGPAQPTIGPPPDAPGLASLETAPGDSPGSLETAPLDTAGSIETTRIRVQPAAAQSRSFPSSSEDSGEDAELWDALEAAMSVAAGKSPEGGTHEGARDTGEVDSSVVMQVLAEAEAWRSSAEGRGNGEPASPDGEGSEARGEFLVPTLPDGASPLEPGGDPDGTSAGEPAGDSRGSDSGEVSTDGLVPGDTLFDYDPLADRATQEPLPVVEAVSAEWDRAADDAETDEGEGGLPVSRSRPGPVTDAVDASGAGGEGAGAVGGGAGGDVPADALAAGEPSELSGAVGGRGEDGSSGDEGATEERGAGERVVASGEEERVEEAVGRVIGVAPSRPDRYRVQAALGRGGAGTVTEVHDLLLDRPVALKMARTDLTFSSQKQADTWLERTEAALTYEARLTARLEDPRIVPVHDLGHTADGRVFFTMKRVRGVSLSEILERMAAGDEALLGEYSLNRRLTLFVQMCLGMAFAHDHGVIHRDLKPGNIMVGEYGTIQIIDWGLARFLDPGPDTPRLPEAIRERDQRVIQGTPGYMAPEQALGDHDAVDHRTDIYALGAILYELLTFRSPIETTRGAESLRTRLYQLALGRFPPPSEAVPGLFVPPELDAICMKALAADRDDRFQDARSLAREVEGYLEGTRLKEEAARLAGRGRRLSEEYRALQGALQEARRAARLARERTPRWAPVEEKELLWALEDNEAEIEQRRTVTFADAVRAFHEALGYDRESNEARNGLAEIYWTRVVEMEEEGRIEEARYYEREARQYDTGALADRLDGHGKLVLTTRPEGLDAELFRFEEVQRRLVPQRVASLGRTPLTHAPIPMGSYLVILHRLGFPDVFYPILIRRGQTWQGVVEVPDQPIDPGWAFIPGGPCIVGGDSKAPGSIERTEVHVPGFFMRRTPVSCQEYCDFLNMLSREEARHRVPRRQDGPRWPEPCWWRDNEGRYFVPRRDRQGQHWHPDLAVTNISWDDAQAYARWLSTQSASTIRLPTENEWEKAARGVDGRLFPWGNHFDPAFCKMAESRPGMAQPEVMGTFPLDESPYGVRDLAGGTSEWVNGFFDDQNLLMTVRGGGWNRSAEYCRAAARSGSPPRSPNPFVTFRLVKECNPTEHSPSPSGNR